MVMRCKHIERHRISLELVVQLELFLLFDFLNHLLQPLLSNRLLLSFPEFRLLRHCYAIVRAGATAHLFVSWLQLLHLQIVK